ncbi:alternative ribosome rescue factor ArfA [Sphingomonas sp. 3-13AW]|uniref:alternative ribosome rescue factor ArfA n=1 Tax=Sphingomonas sp. 3-13AW TaxID=3050450 RepID=UPI003BB7BE5E
MKTKLRQVEAMRNPMAALLAHGANRPRTVATKKGRGSFRRAEKHKARAFA